MKLYLANIHDITPKHLSLISPERAAKARRYRFSADRKRCIAGGLLLRRFLGETAVYTDAFGKPRAANGAFFNLSHSGDWALLAVGDGEIGCDIEQIRVTNTLRLGKTVFTAAEMDMLRRSFDRLGTFFTFWTKKEALLKCMGKGFHRAAASVDVCGDTFAEDGHVYHMRTKSFADSAVSVCTMDSEADMATEWVRF